MSGHLRTNIWAHQLPSGKESLEDQVCQPEDKRTGHTGEQHGGGALSELQLCRAAAPLQLKTVFSSLPVQSWTKDPFCLSPSALFLRPGQGHRLALNML